LTLAGDRLTLAVSVPRQAPADHLGTAGSFSLDIAGLHLPAAVPPLGGVIDHIAVAGVVLGAIPALPLPQALDTWQKQGGTLEVRQLDLAWQSLAASGNGTLALDASLQPIGAFSMELAGYGAILNALVVGGQLKPDAARFIRLGLDLLAQPDASGHRVLKAPVTLQDGSVYIGPARLAKMPVIRW
jgi:hypothetical protein